jgi:integrase
MDRVTPYLANRVLAAVRRLFNWCIERDIVQHSPAEPVKAPGREIKHDRILAADEIIACWAAWDEQGFPFGLLAPLLLVTGQRLGEVAHMRWSNLDLEAGTWALPPELTKSSRAHLIPLSSLAAETIAALPRQTGDFVFSTRRGERPVSGFSRTKQRCDYFSGVGDWRLHDLRRTAATGMAELGV